MLALTALALTSSCQDDFNTPSIKVPEASLTPNTSIADLKARYWSDDANYIDTVLPENGEKVIIAGRVISSDASGNIYKNLVIQDKTAAITLSINANSLFNTYRVGQEIVLDATGMYLGKYSGLQQFGFPDYSEGYGWQATFMPLAFFEQHAQLNGLPEPSKVDTITVKSFSELTGTPEGLRRWQSQLVRFNNCHFLNGGQATFTEGHKITTNQDLILEDGSTIIVRTSGYSNFWSDVLPEGNGDVVGILGYFSGSWQLTLRSISDCMNFGNPTLSPGHEDNPYSVDQAIEFQMNGEQASGWVIGYIVGAVAPGVSTITSDEDIQWGKEVDMPTTLVIAPTPAVKSIANCLVLPLPQGSALRQYGALATNPDLYQRQIWVNGSFALQLGSWGVATKNGSATEFKIEGVEVEGSTPVAGDGTKSNPYTVDQVLALGSPGTVNYVTGYIVGWVEGASIAEGSHFGVPASSASNVLIAASQDETNYARCVPVQLVSGTDIRKAVNLMDNPGNLGKKLVLQGSLEKYFGQAGVKSPTDDYTLDGQGTTPPDTPNPPTGTGDGSQSNPYTVSQVIGLNNPGTVSFVKGYIVGWVDGASITDGAHFTVPSSSASNILIAESPNENVIANCVPVQLVNGTDIRKAVNLMDNPGNLGKEIILEGSLEKYFGVAGVKSTTNNFTLNGEGSGGGGNGGGTTPSTPGNPAGEGTQASPYNIAKVISLNNPGTVSYVEGYIVGWVDGASIQTGAHFGVPSTSASNILLADSPTETDINNCVPLQLVNGTDIRKAVNLMDNPGNLGKKLVVEGSLEKYFGVAGVKSPTNNFTIDGQGGNGGNGGGTTPDDPVTPPTGDGGTKDAPYTCAQVIALNNPGTVSYVTGYIVGWVNGASIQTGATFSVPATGFSNILIADSPTEKDYTKCVPLQLVSGTAIRSAVNLGDHPENLGKKLTVQGSLEKYFGVPGIKSPTADYTIQ